MAGVSFARGLLTEGTLTDRPLWERKTIGSRLRDLLLARTWGVLEGFRVWPVDSWMPNDLRSWGG